MSTSVMEVGLVGKRGLLREIIERLRDARRTESYCPVNDGGHVIAAPAVKTGGQGRSWKLYGRCSACGMTGVAEG